MTKFKQFKKTLIQLVILLAISSIASCNYAKTEDSKEIAEEQNDAKFDDDNQEKDAQFLVEAAEINLEEIQLGQLAQQNGQSTHVKELGKMMEDVHNKSLNDLLTLAKSKNITVPNIATEDAQEVYKTLNKKTGKDFDKAYADIMVSGHKDAIKTFEKASTDGADTDIKNWATATLPDLRTHLEHSIECQKNCDKM